MKILRDLLALVGLATLVIAGYCYYSACKNPIEVVVIQKKKAGKELQKGADSAEKDVTKSVSNSPAIATEANTDITAAANTAGAYENNPAHLEEQEDIAEAAAEITIEAV